MGPNVVAPVTTDVNIKGSDAPLEVKQVETTDVNIKGSDAPLEVKQVVQPGDAPMNVKVVDDKQPAKHTTKKDGSMTLEPDTTEEQDINVAGQRKVNLIWEDTQRWIAIMVCASTMLVGILHVISTVFYDKPDRQIPTIFAVAFGTVIGFYFARTNHQAIGGIGRKADAGQAYKGR